jgi:hypothetical protein
MPYEQPQWSLLSSAAEATAFENILASGSRTSDIGPEWFMDDAGYEFEDFEPDEDDEDDETLPFNLPPLTGDPGTVFGRDV